MDVLNPILGRVASIYDGFKQRNVKMWGSQQPSAYIQMKKSFLFILADGL